MKGRHVVILVFVFGLSLMAILFRVLPHARPAPRPPLEWPPVSRPAPPPPTPLPPPPEASGTLEVLVKTKGSPVKDATVSLHSSRGERTRQLVTDDGGRVLVPLEPGSWSVVARGPGAGAAVASGTATIELRQAARVELDLAAGVRLEGTVRDESGAPVSGAKITLSLSDPSFTARTDANGRYSIQDLPKGVHSVTASSDRLRPQTITNLELRIPGQTVTQDFALKFGASLAGRVVDETGTPVPRAVVTITNEVARVVRADENGEFRADGLGEGLVTVSVAARGYAPASENGIAPGRTEPLILTLPRGGVVAGKVEGLTTAFTVTLTRYDEATARTQVIRSLPFPGEANGVFQIRDLPRGRYELSVETFDRRTPVPLGVTVEAGQTMEVGPLVLTAK